MSKEISFTAFSYMSTHDDEGETYDFASLEEANEEFGLNCQTEEEFMFEVTKIFNDNGYDIY